MPVAQRSRPRPRFSPPRQRTGRLRRERLLARLSSALDTDGVLLLAPSGYGKTTLVVDWLRESEVNAAWLALNSSHRDPRALGSDLVGALARIHPAVQSLSERLDAGDGPQDPSAIWFELARALEDADDFAMLVVDDLDELIGAGEALALLDRLLADPLPAVHPVFAARRPPELPSRPRKAAGGDLTVLDASELAFTDAESEALLDQAGVLDATARASICARAGGWPLALALLSSRTSDSSRPGGARAEAALEEFIDNEVLTDLTAEDRAFLEACAVPSYFDGDIAAELTQRTDAAAALRSLLGRVQLLEAVGDGPWLRMHTLLREHCLARLAREDTARLKELRRRAAQALAGRGELDEATDLALGAEAWLQARDSISEQAERLTGRGAWGTLAGWLARLPREVIHETPALALLEVRVVIRLMRLTDAHVLLDRLEGARLAPGDQAQALLYRAVAFRQARRLDDARREHRRARALIEEHEPTDSVLRVEADFEEGTTLGMAGDVLPAVRMLQRAAEGAEARGSSRLAAEGHQNLGLALQLAGQLGAAQEAMREARRRWEYLGEREFQLLALNNEATAAQALGELDAAAAAYRNVAEQATELGIPRMQALGELGLADVARDRGELDAAEPHYNEASRIARVIDHAGVEAAAAFGKAMALRERGELAEARTLLEHHLQVTQEQGTSEFVTRFRIGLAGVLLSEGRPEEAHAALREVLAAPGGGLQRRQLALLMRATAEFRLGRPSEMEGTLTELQGLVEALGYDQFMLAEARLCGDLLADESVAGLPGGYYPRLLKRARPRLVAPATAPQAVEAQPDFVVRALGKLTVTRPGDARPDLQWRGQRSKELFLFLLVNGRAVSREEVDEALWPEAPPSRLASLFHSALHRLRRAMGQETVLHDRGGYDLNTALVLDYDVSAFEEQLAEADRAGDGEERALALRAAVAAYRGEFAPHVDSRWVEATRERLAERYVAARLALAALELAAGRFAEAVTHAEAALAADAVSDEATRHLIAAHVGAGHPDLALRAYRRLQDLLEQDSRAVASNDTLRALARALGEAGPSRI